MKIQLKHITIISKGAAFARPLEHSTNVTRQIYYMMSFKQTDFGGLFQTLGSNDVDVDIEHFIIYMLYFWKHKASLFPAMLLNLGSLRKPLLTADKMHLSTFFK